ncbi:MAG: hypothetical protein KDK27_13510, partial [Leptospiraceae bacterium]|nr:hypothetical protein [Leptospiraceae bacterium]
GERYINDAQGERRPTEAFQEFERDFAMVPALQMRAFPSIYFVNNTSQEIVYHMLGYHLEQYKALLERVRKIIRFEEQYG